ncbi:MAG TPA: DedA family protein [Amycolatopsis sp.]|nr:DedA family protein [Amycolatopsis sp.]
MFDLLQRITELLHGTLDSPWLWLVVFAVAGLDALLPFMPSETTVITVAVLIGFDPPRLLLLIAVAAGGALLGDCASHWIGRRAGPAMLARLQRGERGQDRYDWARGQVERHGTLLIIAARYIPGGRVATGLATGSMGVPWARFVAFDALGAGIWAAYSTAVGCVGGAAFTDQPHKALLVSFAIGLLMVGVIEVGRRLRSRCGARGLRDDHRQAVRISARGGTGRGAGR